MLKNLKQPRLNHILHRIMIDLALPTAKFGSVVGNDTLPPHRLMPANPTVCVNQPANMPRKVSLVSKKTVGNEFANFYKTAKTNKIRQRL